MKLIPATLLSISLLAVALPLVNRAEAAPAVAQDSQITIVRSGSQAPLKGTADRFTGSMRTELLFGVKAPGRASGGLVTFETARSRPIVPLLSRLGCVRGTEATPTSAPESEASSDPGNDKTEKAKTMKIRLTIDGKTTTATLIDSETTSDFVSLLPLTLMMNDLFRREKFGHLPRAISTGGKPSHTYEVGDVAYWPPGPDVAGFYRHDGQKIPHPGIIVIGKLDSGAEAFDVPGSIQVTIERDE